MMIRLNSNEIRFRLSQTEVRHLLDRGSLRENVVLPSSQLSFCVKPLSDSEKVSRVSQEGEQITFWLASDDQAKLSFPHLELILLLWSSIFLAIKKQSFHSTSMPLMPNNEEIRNDLNKILSPRKTSRSRSEWPEGPPRFKGPHRGTWGLGCPAASYLASAGVGTLGLVDGDFVDQTNLHRQLLYSDQDLGLPKVSIAGRRLRTLSPSAVINEYFEPLNRTNAATLLGQYDVILDCTDNFETKYLLNDICLQLEKPLVAASATGFEAYLMVISKDGPCLRCLYPNATAADVGSCNLTGVLGPSWESLVRGKQPKL
ncbi:MAG: HesA/MoeB/ThiF family protein [Bdellovibrionales bacterium]|nr:HesA/MoeB/ThiF family protein [Bdellovibrionales bacterium]